MEDYAIKISELSKKYRIGQLKSTSLRESLFNFSKNKEENYFWALKDINLTIQRGEAVGIIGKNGAGKSTLLKILSKITYPTSGKVELIGRVSSLLEVGTGFHPELSGRENVFLNGTILGMRRNEIKSKFDEIVDFSGVASFIDTPIKHYSSGMKVRLAFAVAAFLEPEILIIDEVLAVGDADFQKKCLGKMEEVTGEGRTVLFVSHNMHAVKNLCSKAVLLKEGKKEMESAAATVIDYYLRNESQSTKQAYTFLNEKIRKGAQNIIFESLKFNKLNYESGEEIRFRVSIKGSGSKHASGNIDFGIAVKGSNELNLIHMTNRFINKVIHFNGHEKKVDITFSNILKPGKYSLVLFLRVNGIIEDWLSDVAPFEIMDSNPYGYSNTQEITGIIFPQYSIND